MERLKSILADKVLDLSSDSGDAVKAKIDRIQRFRDFANALKSLMIKYPAIEDELIAMIKDDDFDTKVASSRVDTVIRLADTEAAQMNRVVEPIRIELAEESTISTKSELVDNDDLADYVHSDDIPMEIYEGREEPLYQPEDIDYEVLAETAEPENEYTSYAYSENEESYTNDFVDQKSDENEDFDAEVIDEQVGSVEPENESFDSESDSAAEDIEAPEDDITLTAEELAAKRKTLIKRVIQIAGIILAVVILIFIIKFVMTHWQTVLIIGGVVIVLIILFVWFKRKR